MVVHTCNPSCSGGWDGRIDCTRKVEVAVSRDHTIALQSGQQEGNSISKHKIKKKWKGQVAFRACWCALWYSHVLFRMVQIWGVVCEGKGIFVSIKLVAEAQCSVPQGKAEGACFWEVSSSGSFFFSPETRSHLVAPAECNGVITAHCSPSVSGLKGSSHFRPPSS